MRKSAICCMVLMVTVLTAGFGKGVDTTGPSEESLAAPVPHSTPAADKEITLDLGGGVTMELVLISAGSFMMGDARGITNEEPVHKVTITKAFYLGKYEVTQEQWDAVMGNNWSRFKGPKNPVE